MSFLDFFVDAREALQVIRRARKARILADRKREVARAFNSIHTYRAVSNKQSMWMCPDCNRVHECIDYSVFDGRHFPACCRFPHGNRLQSEAVAR